MDHTLINKWWNHQQVAVPKKKKMAQEKKHSIGVVVGRYHVDNLTAGHLAVLNQALTECHRLIVFVGITPVLDSVRNPLDFQSREMMLRNVLGAYNPVIVPITDMACDHKWSKTLDKKIRELAPFGSVQLYGSRDSFLHHYHGQFGSTTVNEVVGISATIKRQEICAKPRTNSDFRAGVIYGKTNTYPSVHPTVDIGVWRERHSDTKKYIQVLLGRKPAEDLFRFPGGFVDPKDPSYEIAALRELFEETHISPDHIARVEYIESRQVDDWRYRTDRNKIVTTLFAMKYDFSEDEAEAGDDLAQVKWFDLEEIRPSLFEDVHKQLWVSLVNKAPWLKS